MTLEEKQEKITNYILGGDNLYEEVLWLVSELTDMLKEKGKNIDDIFDYALE